MRPDARSPASVCARARSSTAKFVEKVRRANGIVAFEWQRSGDGWRSKACPEISQIIGLASHQARVDRCALQDDDGSPLLKKSWRERTSSDSSIRASRCLARVCPSDHRHGRIQGVATRGTGRYTAPVPKHFFGAFVEGLFNSCEAKKTYPADRDGGGDVLVVRDRVDPALAHASPSCTRSPATWRTSTWRARSDLRAVQTTPSPRP